MNIEDHDIIDALSFLDGQTIKQIADKTGISEDHVRLTLKRLFRGGDVVKKGRKYKYPNSNDEEIGYHYQVKRQELL